VGELANSEGLRRIRYSTSAKGLTPRELFGFFEGWPNPPSPATHLQLLESSAEIVLAVDEEARRVVGFITAISDGVLSAYIPLLEVVPECRGRGIGSELVRRMIALLEDFYMVDLLCDAELQGFYESLGITPATGMMLRRYEHQAGIAAEAQPGPQRPAAT